MVIMFILMFLPLFAIPVFWLLPIDQAIPVYIAALALSGWMFWLMRRNRHRAVKTGKESLIGREAQIRNRSDGKRPRYTILIDGELWTVRSNEILKTGETVVITGDEGNTLIVRPGDKGGQRRQQRPV